MKYETGEVKQVIKLLLSKKKQKARERKNKGKQSYRIKFALKFLIQNYVPATMFFSTNNKYQISFFFLHPFFIQNLSRVKIHFRIHSRKFFSDFFLRESYLMEWERP